MVTEDDVRLVLRPRLGSRIVDYTDIPHQVASVLKRYTPWRDSLQDVNRELQGVLFNCLYQELGNSMTFMMDDGSFCRIYLKDLPILADVAMQALFQTMNIYPVHYQKLMDEAVQHASLSAAKVLLQRFHKHLQQDQKILLSRIVRENYPQECYRDWMNETLFD